MSWHIVSMQKPIPKAANWGHNYVALVDDDGNIVEQFHGNFTSDPVQLFSVNPNNPLKVQSDDALPDQKNNVIRTQNYVPIKLRDGTVSRGIAVDAVPPGDEQRMRAIWNTGKNAVSDALSGNKFLYKTATGLGFGGEAINSNSVWFTFLKAIGVSDPIALNGPAGIPGGDVDLRTHKTNNPLYRPPAKPGDAPTQPGTRGSTGNSFYGDRTHYGEPPFDASAPANLGPDQMEPSRDSESSPAGAPWLRAALERRAANLGVTYGEYMPTDALLAEIHDREAAATRPENADAIADSIEHEIDTIGVPFLMRPELADPPPLGLTPPTRADLDRRAAALGLRFGPAVPDDRVMARFTGMKPRRHRPPRPMPWRTGSSARSITPWLRRISLGTGEMAILTTNRPSQARPQDTRGLARL